jgi:eukaryotic-like serine/threonine-protein kinase
MDPERWQRVQDAFLNAAELSFEEQAAYLDAVCDGDPDFRKEVEALLTNDRTGDDFLGPAVSDAAAACANDNEVREEMSFIGRRVGPYVIVRAIGRGGMGTVFQAVRMDEEYLNSVAVKFIADGMQTPEVLSRFRTERQILASLQHPNIAALLDGGTTEDGRPYIVMEYIEGEPLLDYCQRKKLNTTERLKIFHDLCLAVQHAHQMLVIHRDIKPANILVTNSGAPKLLDFGIAKLLAPELVGGDRTTETIMRRLTPLYASPEQVKGEPLTTATDIYSLGVVLYQLLTSATPYRVHSSAPHEIPRVICEEEPMRLTSGVRDRKLRRELSGDLENIVAMALRKEPHRRYPSAQQFADDIDRYLKGLPVSARDETLLYLVTKMVRRNKLAAAAFALLAVSIAAGWTATIRQARRTEARFEQVRKLANSVLFDFHAQIQKLPGSTPVRERLVRTALEYLNHLSQDAAGDRSLEWDLAQAYEQVGDAQGDPGGASLGQYTEAMASYRMSLSIVERQLPERRDYEALSCAVWLHYKLGDLELRSASLDDAVRSYTKGLKSAAAVQEELKDQRGFDLLRNGYQRVAMAKLRQGDTEAAEENARSAAAMADAALGGRSPARAKANIARTLLLLGNILWIRGSLEQSWSTSERALTLLEDVARSDPSSSSYAEDLVDAYRRAGDLQANPSFFHFGNVKRAMAYHTEAVAMAERLAARDTHDAQAQARLYLTLRHAAAVLRGVRPAEATGMYERSLEGYEKLMRGAEGDLSYQRDLANTRLGLGIALAETGRYKPAIEHMEKALQMQRALVRRSPERAVLNEDLFDTLRGLGGVELKLGEWDRSLEHLREALSLAQSLVSREPSSLYPARCLALASQALGDYYSALGRRQPAYREAAEEWYGKSLAIWSRWKADDLATPYSTDREREVLERLARIRPVPAARQVMLTPASVDTAAPQP